jgi:Spy/CpxP family protein refolding chaperone
MNRVTGLLILLFTTTALVGCSTNPQTNQDNSPDLASESQPYAGQEQRGIKSLSQEDVKGLQAGHGTPFGGMAKLAELNGYPGPRHVLEMADEIDLTDDQQQQIENLYDQMLNEAIPLGEQIIEVETQMDNSFQDQTITKEGLEAWLNQSANLYGKLRFVHLKYHFDTLEILTQDQVDQYNQLRGYTSDQDPCQNIPEGHDPDMWRLHNNCN